MPFSLEREGGWRWYGWEWEWERTIFGIDDCAAFACSRDHSAHDKPGIVCILLRAPKHKTRCNKRSSVKLQRQVYSATASRFSPKKNDPSKLPYVLYIYPYPPTRAGSRSHPEKAHDSCASCACQVWCTATHLLFFPSPQKPCLFLLSGR
jgi:hypothetical protein